MENSEFERRFLYGLIHDCYEFQDNNTDFLTFGPDRLGRIRSRLRDRILLLARRKGFVRKHFSVKRASERLMNTLRNLDELESLYQLLRDAYSKQLLIELLKFRILGGQHVRLPLNDKQYWSQYFSVDKKLLKERHTSRAGKWHLNRYQLEGLDGRLDVHAHPVGILNTFLLEQYAYKKGGRIIQVEPGDIVIDAGGGWGEVALYFADNTGPTGKVYCFEFVQESLEILRQNLSLNRHLADRIELVPKALWDRSGEIVNYSATGPGTSLVRDSKQERSLQVSALSIDDFVKEEGIARVDFVKMDIEGSELNALHGAAQTLRTFGPKLAIALYHHLDDFLTIPDYLSNLGVPYEFFLDHFSIHQEETILFASPLAV